MSSMFRRTNSQSSKQDFGNLEPLADAVSDTNLTGSTPKNNSRRFSLHKSSSTTGSNTPPSPGSPLEMARTSKESAAQPTVPNPDDFRKKNRASTGFSLSKRTINFANGPSTKSLKRPTDRRRRASSLDGGKAKPSPSNLDAKNPAAPLADRLPWALPAEAGTGVKARRMSLNLPDDFTVDVAELLSEFEYQHKILGRHGKHLGRGATSRVTLMGRKGCPGELYAVKEFRGKSRQETALEYEKKVKSEYSIAKSLHHPNIVETVRLCTDHGRWNHVMEYCSEGDLYGLVQKGYLKTEARSIDRFCLFKQLIQGINYLHCNGIAHRDVKLENLLITKDSKLKITDFGVSDVFSGIHPGLREAGGQCGKNMGEIRLCAPGICGSMPYIAPEVVAKHEEYDPRKLDVWSSAIIMIYLTFGGAMWEKAEKGNGHYDALVKGWEKWNAKHSNEEEKMTDADYPSVPAFDAFVNPPALRRVMLQMLNPDPAKRIAISEVINNRWVKNIECCQLESYEDPTKTIDASKKGTTKSGTKKIFCHSHVPPKEHKMGTLPKMPQYAGY
jgi:protein-serine/threonine kinase